MQNDNVKLKNFVAFNIPEFPKNINTVYIIFAIKDSNDCPFYVGETRNLRRRIGEYVVASFQAPTDFKVGEAIKYLHDKGYKITIRYKQTSDRKQEEKDIIQHLKFSGVHLLNDLSGFDRKTADKTKEYEKIVNFLSKNFKF